MISPSDLRWLRDSFSDASEEELPATLCGDFADLLGVSDVTISLFSTAEHFTIGSSSSDVRTLDEWAFTFQEGPCLEATAHATYHVADTARGAASRWPRLAAKAHAMGFRSLAGVPMQLDGEAFASMNLHDRFGSIEAATLEDAEVMARELAPLIVGRLRRQPPTDDHVGRAVFHQATGMLMHQMGVSARIAVDLLRTYAWAHDRQVSEVAEDIVDRKLTSLDT